ncbi:MAG: 50S ribosomal protein L13 [Lentisphaeria bacterium]|nr:50S ribosomal protein L13 [Candidatus Neomarinimicrobiota bacterium]MCF7841350.1 50S ribosomal protein L13 [Lentisphaeria bacterium]
MFDKLWLAGYFTPLFSNHSSKPLIDTERELSLKTYNVRASEIQKDWWVVNAADQTLGRLATEIARILRGKHKPTFTPHLDTGDFVVVINADKIVVTGNKEIQKIYRRHSGYPGGMKESRLAEVREKHPDRIIQNAVKGMLPHTSLGRAQMKKLKIYAGPSHPHEAQQPKELKLG